MTLTRNQAKMIAEELYKIARPDIVKAMKEIAINETDEYLCAKDAAKILGWQVDTLYRRKDLVGGYTKLNGQLRFSKSYLNQAIRTGVI